MYQALLLKLQQINSVPCFLLTDDPCQVLSFSINDYQLNELKKQVCFPLSDGSFFVKPGVKIGFKCLHDLLTKKVEEKLKQSKNIKTQATTTAPFNILSSSFSMLPVTTNTSASSTTNTPPSLTTNTPATQMTPSSFQDVPSISIIEHKRYFLNLLKQWCLNHKDHFKLDTFDLKDGKDFSLNVAYNEKHELEANVRCNCSRLIALTIKKGNVQLSNFQKHLRTTNCTHMKSLKKINAAQKKIELQQTTTASSSSTAATLTSAAPIQQQSILQVPVVVSAGASSIISGRSTNNPTTISQTNSQKRSRPLSQLSSSQK
ncbi:unnamed protein product, partial [Rotaria sp. Silwood2]